MSVSVQRVVMTSIFILAVAACQTTADNTASLADTGTANYKIGKPYKIAGNWYYPKEDFSYDRTGLASWYGDKFDGKNTANGEVYDQTQLTAAHKTLPMPVMVRVTNLENGKQVVVRVNDRGPFVRGRIIDLSSHAAGLLGFREAGVAKVRVEYLGKANRQTRIVAKATTHQQERFVEAAAPVDSVDSDELAPLAGSVEAQERTYSAAPESNQFSDIHQVAVEGDPNIYVQAGSFQVRDNAVRMKSTLERTGYKSPGVEIRAASVNGIQYYRVQIGPVEIVDAADQMLANVLASGYAGARIIIN